MENKKILLKTNENEFYDKIGNRFWIAQYDLPCSICGQQKAVYFTTRSPLRYCDNCVTILFLDQVFSAQLEVEKRRKEILKQKKATEKRLDQEKEAEKKRAKERLEAKAHSLYTAFMDYHRVHNCYIKPAWDDAIEGDKDHFYHMADYLMAEELNNE